MTCKLQYWLVALFILPTALFACNDSNEDHVSVGDASVEDLGGSDAQTPIDAANLPDFTTIVDHGIPTDSYLNSAPCEPMVPEAATRTPGDLSGGARLTVNGRLVAQYGIEQPLDGFPSNIATSPSLPVLYVTSTSHDDRVLYVLDKETLTPRQQFRPNDVYAGLFIEPISQRLFVSGGESSTVLVYDINEDGLLSNERTLPASGHVNYVHFDVRRDQVWFTQWDRSLLGRVNTVNPQGVEALELPSHGWRLLEVDSDTIWVSTLSRPEIYVKSLADSDGPNQPDAQSNELRIIPTTGAVAELCQITEHIFGVLSDGDALIRFNVNSPDEQSIVALGLELRSRSNEPLPNTNANAIACDSRANRIYVARGADNLISVFDASTLDHLGLIPTGEYPTALVVDEATQTLWISEGKGGTGPNEGRSGKSVISGFVRRLDLNALDLAETTAQAEANFMHPKTVFPFECDGFFPIPTRQNQPTPIEHVILVVKENKTFDCIFGDLDPSRANVEPSLTLFGEEITPNLHALASQFALSDNFYTEVEDSDIGHILLTAAHLTEYVQRIWIEKDHSRHIPEGYQLSTQSMQREGNFFTHLMNHDISLKIMGEIVGTNARAQGDRGQVSQNVDYQFPGGPFVNYQVKDEVKAHRLIEFIQSQSLPQFTYILLPNDHTLGTRPGAPTPESMVADNDYAVGLIVDALSHSPYWQKSAVIILQDDPQGCGDHVDVHRSPLLVVSPWARKNYISHTRASFMSIFATIEHVLNIPPMGRGDGSASPIWDMFSAQSDTEPFNAIPRRIPEAINNQQSIGAELSRKMDFRGPDRNPALGPLLEVYMAHRSGKLTTAQARDKLNLMQMNWQRWLATVEEAVEEVFSFDAAIKDYHDHLDKEGLDAPRFPRDGFGLGPQ